MSLSVVVARGASVAELKFELIFSGRLRESSVFRKWYATTRLGNSATTPRPHPRRGHSRPRGLLTGQARLSVQLRRVRLAESQLVNEWNAAS